LISGSRVRCSERGHSLQAQARFLAFSGRMCFLAQRRCYARTLPPIWHAVTRNLCEISRALVARDSVCASSSYSRTYSSLPTLIARLVHPRHTVSSRISQPYGPSGLRDFSYSSLASSPYDDSIAIRLTGPMDSPPRRSSYRYSYRLTLYPERRHTAAKPAICAYIGTATTVTGHDSSRLELPRLDAPPTQRLEQSSDSDP